MRSVEITQQQMIDLLTPLFEHVNVKADDVSVVKVTASSLEITHVTQYGSVTQHIDYVGGN